MALSTLRKQSPAPDVTEEEDVEQTTPCFYCVDKEKLTTFESLHPGSHISLPRLAGLYYHHAIVVKVAIDANDSTKATITLIEYKQDDENDTTGIFSSFFPRSCKYWKPKAIIAKTSLKYDLAKDNILLIKYKEETHPPMVVLQRANSGVGKKNYNLFGENCEHFATWCKIGTCESFQVEDMNSNVGTFLAQIAAFLAKCLRIFASFAKQATRLLKFIKHGGSAALAVASAVFIITLCSVKLCGLRKKKRNGCICQECYGTLITKYISRLVIVLTTTVVSIVAISLICAFTSLPGWIVFLIAGAISLLGFGLEKLFPGLYRRLWPSANVPQKCLESPDSRAIQPGDVVTYPYYKIPHEGVVLKVSEESGKTVQLTIAHYAWPSFFSRRRIMAEPFTLCRDSILLHDYTGFCTYPPEEVLERVKERLGEKRFNSLFNRSSHFANWCKVREGKKSYHS